MSDFNNSAVVPAMLASIGDFVAGDYMDTVPTNLSRLLRGCTVLVLDATEGAYYDVDPLTGLANDPTTLAAMKDATCIQAAAWSSLGIDPATGGVVTSGVKTSKGIGTARISYGDVAQASAARAAAVNGLVPAAERRLRQANLIGSEPWTFG